MRLFKTSKPKSAGYFPAAAVLGKASSLWRQSWKKLAVRLNSRIAKLSRRSLIWVISAFCLVTGTFSFHLLYKGIVGHRTDPAGFSTGPAISQPTTPLLSDSALQAIQQYRAAHPAPSKSNTDSLIKK
jgi:hypothetical protein